MAPTIEAVSTRARQAVDEATHYSIVPGLIMRKVIRKWIRGLADGETFAHGRASGSLEPREWTSCDHVSDEPQLCFGLACVPGHLMCSACFLRAAEAWGDSRCDWCSLPGKTYPMLCPLGPVVVLMLLCREHGFGEGASCATHSRHTPIPCCKK